MQFHGRGILLDIEGTTSSVSFVYDVMFPFARRELAGYLAAHWQAPECRAACRQIAQDAGHESLETWAGDAPPDQRQGLVTREVLRLMDADAKTTGLKELQGLIWRAGFESGELEAHLYEDVPPALLRWRRAGLDVRIYSSGSVAAQRLFFGHTICGDLLEHFRGHYDTAIGAKKEAASYTAIAADYQLPAEEILFVSDIAAELDAARTAGMITALCLREGNAEAPPRHGHQEIRSFDEIHLFGGSVK